jgi:uncharacterized protein
MNFVERAIAFDCEGERLVGIVAEPEYAGTLGIVLVVGGPQYRVGSHRQFVQLARRLASTGMPVVRFDYRGMGDSTGPALHFGQTAPDIAAAVDALLAASPTVEKVVLWGLCDAAAGALLYHEATADTRINGMVLLNPWVRSDATLARTYLKHYYAQRLLEKAFWVKLLRGRVDVGASLRSAAGNVSAANDRGVARGSSTAAPFQERMAVGLRTFGGPVLVLLSERDLTAREFMDYAQASPEWSGLLDGEHVERRDIAGADHTFSDPLAKAEMEASTLDWLRRNFMSAKS